MKFKDWCESRKKCVNCQPNICQRAYYAGSRLGERRKTVQAKRPVQQLKAEIAAIADDIGDQLAGKCMVNMRPLYDKLRQLSAI
jgi:hypothetical protein